MGKPSTNSKWHKIKVYVNNKKAENDLNFKSSDIAIALGYYEFDQTLVWYLLTLVKIGYLLQHGPNSYGIIKSIPTDLASSRALMMPVVCNELYHRNGTKIVFHKRDRPTVPEGLLSEQS